MHMHWREGCKCRENPSILKSYPLNPDLQLNILYPDYLLVGKNMELPIICHKKIEEILSELWFPLPHWFLKMLGESGRINYILQFMAHGHYLLLLFTHFLSQFPTPKSLTKCNLLMCFIFILLCVVLCVFIFLFKVIDFVLNCSFCYLYFPSTLCF